YSGRGEARRLSRMGGCRVTATARWSLIRSYAFWLQRDLFRASSAERLLRALTTGTFASPQPGQ
ncbi:MAG: hypothetical protein QM581_08295, partial [Pseudomonas sp.]